MTVVRGRLSCLNGYVNIALGITLVNKRILLHVLNNGVCSAEFLLYLTALLCFLFVLFPHLGCVGSD
jgi:hypothetical protein